MPEGGNCGHFPLQPAGSGRDPAASMDLARDYGEEAMKMAHVAVTLALFRTGGGTHSGRMATEPGSRAGTGALHDGAPARSRSPSSKPPQSRSRSPGSASSNRPVLTGAADNDTQDPGLEDDAHTSHDQTYQAIALRSTPSAANVFAVPGGVNGSRGRVGRQTWV